MTVPFPRDSEAMFGEDSSGFEILSQTVRVQPGMTNIIIYAQRPGVNLLHSAGVLTIAFLKGLSYNETALVSVS